MRKIGIDFPYVRFSLLIDWQFLEFNIGISWAFGFSICFSILFFAFEINFHKKFAEPKGK